MGIRAGATDTSEKSRSSNGSFATNGLGVEAFVFSDFEVAAGDLASFDFKIKAS